MYTSARSRLSAANTYSGGTNIENGILQLSETPNLSRVGSLGSGVVYVATPGTLDSTAAQLTVSGLQDYGNYQPGPGVGGTITDTSGGQGVSESGVTVLTVNTPTVCNRHV